MASFLNAQNATNKAPGSLTWTKLPISSDQFVALRSLSAKSTGYDFSFRSAVQALMSAFSTVNYSYDAGSDQESFAVGNVRTVYDAVDLALALRNVYGVDAPASSLLGPEPAVETGAPAPGQPGIASTEVPPVLWGFVPLEDGWKRSCRSSTSRNRRFLDRIPA